MNGSQRIFNNSKCICPDGYFDDGYKTTCRPCIFFDLNCSKCTFRKLYKTY